MPPATMILFRASYGRPCRAVIQGTNLAMGFYYSQEEPGRAGLLSMRFFHAIFQWRFVRLQLEAGADANQATTNNGTSLVFIAASEGYLKIVRLLLEAALTRTKPPATTARHRCKLQLETAPWRLFSCCRPGRETGGAADNTEQNIGRSQFVFASCSLTAKSERRGSN